MREPRPWRHAGRAKSPRPDRAAVRRRGSSLAILAGRLAAFRGVRRRTGVPEGPGAERARAGGRRRAAGLGLLEVVITITILTSVMLATILVLVPVARQSRINRETTIANAEARRLIERILAIPFQEIVETYPDGSDLELENLPRGRIHVSYGDPSADPLEIHLELSWTSPDAGPVAFSFVTVRTD